MSAYTLQTLPAVRLAAVTATLDPHTLGQHIGPLFDRAAAAVTAAGGELTTPLATYAQTDDGIAVVVGYAYDGPAPDDLQIVELPETVAVCGEHRGPMATVHESWHAQHAWAIEQGHEFSGPCRELYAGAGSLDQSDWVTILQQPVVG